LRSLLGASAATFELSAVPNAGSKTRLNDETLTGS